MRNLAPLNVFLAYTGEGRGVCEPLAKCLNKLYACKIIWAMEESQSPDGIPSLIRRMVEQADVALFFMTHKSEWVEEEIRLWCDKHGGRFENALLFKDHNLKLDFHKPLKTTIITPPPAYSFNRDDPWADIEYILPAIHKLFCNTPRPGAEWKRRFNEIVHQSSGLIEKRQIPTAQIRQAFEYISEKQGYGDLDTWQFRINWPRGQVGVDSYSNLVTCLDVLEAIVNPNVPATSQEVTRLFSALSRLVESRDKPPKKLSGRWLLEDASLETLKQVRDILGKYPYERPPEGKLEPGDDEEKISNEPSCLLLPREYVTVGDNYDRLLEAQKDILFIASRICTNVLCSPFQISLSRSIQLDAQSGGKVLGMACTAAGTDKEELSAVADVPVLVRSVDGRISWYGQRHRSPTSEHQAHWRYHAMRWERESPPDFIVHFHPVALLELFNLMQSGKVNEQHAFKEVKVTFHGQGLNCIVVSDYMNHRARSRAFGELLFNSVYPLEVQNGITAVIWKPNHGIWLPALEAQKVPDELDKIEEASERALKNYIS